MRQRVLEALLGAPEAGLSVTACCRALRATHDAVLDALEELQEADLAEEDLNGRWHPAAHASESLHPALEWIRSEVDVVEEPVHPDGWRGLTGTQHSIVELPCSESRVVCASAGAGKTHVLCHRVGHLLSQGVPATQILILSFTNAAVNEVRRRLVELEKTREAAWEVRVETIDRLAYIIRVYRDGVPEGGGGYAANIEAAAAILEEIRDPREVLGSIRHLLLDEAQDIEQPRTKLIIEILRALWRAGSGVTVFLDRFQAIYGFSNEDGCGHLETESGFGFLIALHEVWRTEHGSAPPVMRLEPMLFRTADDASGRMAQLHIEARRRVSVMLDDPHGALQGMRELLEELADD